MRRVASRLLTPSSMHRAKYRRRSVDDRRRILAFQQVPSWIRNRARVLHEIVDNHRNRVRVRNGLQSRWNTHRIGKFINRHGCGAKSVGDDIVCGLLCDFDSEL